MARRWTLFIVLGYSLFVAFEAVEGKLSGADTLARIRALETEWDDSARLMTRMVHALGEKQDRIARLEGRIGYAQGTIEDARRIREARMYGTLCCRTARPPSASGRAMIR